MNSCEMRYKLQVAISAGAVDKPHSQRCNTASLKVWGNWRTHVIESDGSQPLFAHFHVKSSEICWTPLTGHTDP